MQIIKYSTKIGLLLFVTLLQTNCSPASIATTAQSTQTSSPTPPKIKTVTLTPTVFEPTPLSTVILNNYKGDLGDEWSSFTDIAKISPHILPEDLEFQALAISKFRKWEFLDLYDPNVYPAIIPNADSYQLDRNWEVNKIEYTYQWLGWGNTYTSSQITKNNNEYLKDGLPVSRQAVENFLASINHLHPTQGPLGYISHTDDYPSWSIEIAGTDKNRILITSTTNSNPLAAPWNVYYNGRFYAQYDGSLFPGMTNLFNTEERELLATTFNGGGPIDFITESLPLQIRDGFFGFFPVRLNYNINSQKGELNLAYYPSLTEDKFGVPTAAKLTLTDQTSIDCAPLKIIETRGASTDYSYEFTYWKISCEPADFVPEQEFHYQMEIIFSKLKEPVTGELWGFWEDKPGMTLFPIPPEVLTPFLKNSDIKEIMKENIVYEASYSSKSRLNGMPPETMEGQVTFLGEIMSDHESVPYLVHSPFVIENGKVRDFSLTQNFIEESIAQLLENKFVKNVLDRNPGVSINLNLSTIQDANHFKVEIICENDKTYSLPTTNEPYMEFNFGHDGYFYSPRFSEIFPHSSFYVLGKTILAKMDKETPKEVLNLLKNFDVTICQWPSYNP